MSRPNITCLVCGGSNFIPDAGQYFCSECNTHSQDVREEVFDEYFGTQKGATRVLQKKAQKIKTTDEKLTSWEALNYVLKGITDELINLGAKPELKIVTLQLWASYLRRLEVAFTSVEVERKPKLGYIFKRSDAEIIYGVTEKQLKEKSWWSRSRDSSTGNSSNTSQHDTESSQSEGHVQSRRSALRRLHLGKKALASVEYSAVSQETAKSFSQTLEELESSTEMTETPKRMKITKHARSLLNSSYASSTDDDHSVRKKLAKLERKSLRNVTIAKVVALINMALAITEQDIQVSDFLRWMEEGHISLSNSKKFLPENAKVDSYIQRMIEINHLSYLSCQKCIVGMCSELDIEELPPPDLNRLAERYCLELQLPDDFTNIVKRLLVLSSRDNTSNKLKNGCHLSKYGEVQVMSAIIVVMKLLFSLDDCTEYRLSRTASEISRVAEEEGDSKQLFVFSDWMRFIECRKAVLSRYHLPTRSAVYGESMGRDPELFLQHYLEMDAPLLSTREVKNRYGLRKDWVEAMTRCLQKLSNGQPESTYLKFPASLTPLHTYTQLLLTQHAERVVPVRNILSQDFTRHSLEHILSSDQCVALGLTNDLNIVMRDGVAAILQEGNITPRDKDTIIIPRYGLNRANLSVSIVKNLKHLEKPEKTINGVNGLEESPNEKFIKNLQELISDSDEEEELDNSVGNKEPPHEVATCHTTLELFNSSYQYWFCHINLSKNSMCHDEFEVFAMNTFPSSFLWMLKECSRMICVPTKDLYANVVHIERKYKFIQNEAYYMLRTCNKRKRS